MLRTDLSKYKNNSRVIFDGLLVTVWSAPNYCYRCGNKAAILELDEDINKTLKTFSAAKKQICGGPVKQPLPAYFL